MGLSSGVRKRGAWVSGKELHLKYLLIDLKGLNRVSVQAIIAEQAPPVIGYLGKRLQRCGWKDETVKETS